MSWPVVESYAFSEWVEVVVSSSYVRGEQTESRAAAPLSYLVAL